MDDKEKIHVKLEFDNVGLASVLFGAQNANLDLISRQSCVRIESRGNSLHLIAESEELIDPVAKSFNQLYAVLKSGKEVFPQDVEAAYRILCRDPGADLIKIFRDELFAVSSKKTLTPRTLTQRAYFSAIRDNDMVFSIGPAGTGKTYLAVAMAVYALQRKEVKKIILTRPAVEAGEKLGFLPGDLVDKVNPYMRPLYDALYDMLDYAKVQDMIEENIIEIAPLAFMRGRTLSNAFVILDEAQNTTPEQMKMFITRLGFGSKAVITGDITQIDLPGKAPSGLVEATHILKNVDGINFIKFEDTDVVRHPLVARIVKAYDSYDCKGN
ncbi:PhoH family protein [Maridesulfovibrio hydrothermalis]|uniref:PhoH-like protein n=1 Tax=Maridesulfovibrio hydrothermalis AM13 = DSM 14728 TaxID=1121451 RepID=L0REP4_9BACT|nr:PhoH family protein [Maridesulfovibrio hydrothermalis]CCO24682.1 phosphate starvation-induced protein [Maridesulfovibrio hydrothermalis AM13 = DSM 14728]